MYGIKNGRGAYLSRDLKVITEAEGSNILDRHLNAEVDASVYEELKQMIEGAANAK